MTEANATCSDARLHRLLRAEEESDEYRQTTQHIDGCSSCQLRLEQLAAQDDLWQEAQSMLQEAAIGQDAEFTTSDARRPSQPAAWRRHPVAWTESMSRQLLSPPAHPEMLGRIGRYEVERLVGAGGMGVVFKACDTELNRPVAIKVLAPFLAHSGAARQRFAREARAAAAVVHEHVVAIHNVETEGDSPFLVMQFVAGESLQQRLDREGPLDVCEILRIGLQTAAGLAAAHAQGLVHRDVKPSNILLEMGVERTLLTDFGLARASDDASLTHTGFHPGTPQYMSPEQARGDVVDERSDLFSLGSVMYAMCTGHSPFRAETSYGILRRITDHDPRAIRQINPQIPHWLEQVIARLLAKPTANRFQSANEVADLLRRCLAHLQQPTSVELPAELQTSTNSYWLSLRYRWLAAITTIVACSAVGFPIANNWSTRPQAAISQPTHDGTTLSTTPNSSNPTDTEPSTTDVDDSGLSVDWGAADNDLRAYEQSLQSFEQKSQQLWEVSPGQQPP